MEWARAVRGGCSAHADPSDPDLPAHPKAVMAATMGLAVVLWVSGDALGVPAVLSAMLGLCVLLITGGEAVGDGGRPRRVAGGRHQPP